MRTLQRYTTENVTELKEGAISRIGDLFYAFRFLRLLTQKWDTTPAFKLGLIDKDGKRLKSVKIETPGQKSAYTVFHRLVFNVKRLLQKLPFGKTTIAKYAAALYLIKEHTHMSEKQIKNIMDKIDLEFDWDNLPLQESKWFINTLGELNPGNYMLVNDIASVNTGEIVALANSKITTLSQYKTPYDTFLGESIYKVYHPKTNQEIFITTGDITR